MFKISPINFKAIYYVKNTGKDADYKYKSISDLKADEFIQDSSPSKEIKEIVENSNFFQKLSKDTDVYISSSIEEVKNPFNGKNSALGTIIAAFNDPYETTKKIAAEMFIIKTANNKNDVYNKLTSVIEELNDYEEVTTGADKSTNSVHFLADGGHITFGEYQTNL